MFADKIECLFNGAFGSIDVPVFGFEGRPVYFVRAALFEVERCLFHSKRHAKRHLMCILL